jgi:hypothetical protein
MGFMPETPTTDAGSTVAASDRLIYPARAGESEM